jgi:5,10-methylene-tetrahydrofolate dehydrogenase/methenyl tetrahydrofolate cyclohydrolase
MAYSSQVADQEAVGRFLPHPKNYVKGKIRPEREFLARLLPRESGGVGPMTITMLMYNTVESAKRAAGKI